MVKLLEGKRAVVTGSSRGLGRAHALGLAAEGAKVVINGTSAPDIEAVVSEIRQNGGTAVGCVESVASMGGAERIIDCAVDNFGGVDILVNNAGIDRPRTFLKMSEEQWDAVIAVNLKGTFACSKFAAPYMQQQNWGRIINIVSGAGLQGSFGQCNYASSKAGQIALTFTLAIELSRYGITCNAVRHQALTRMSEAAIKVRQELARKAGRYVPNAAEMGYNPPEAAAPLVVYLATEEASWINGQLIGIDGPWLNLYSRSSEFRKVFMPNWWTVELLRQHFKPTLGEWLHHVPSQTEYLERRLTGRRQLP